MQEVKRVNRQVAKVITTQNDRDHVMAAMRADTFGAIAHHAYEPAGSEGTVYYWHPLDDGTYTPGLGVWTTDNETVGSGFTANSRYTGDFGGTSSATPLVAGIAALIISANPALGATQVKDILRRTADKIEDPRTDEMTGEAFGRYDSRGHSRWFGYGKVMRGVRCRKPCGASVAPASRCA